MEPKCAQVISLACLNQRFVVWTVHTKNELVRGSKSSQTLNDKQVSTMIRDRYLDQLAFYKHIGVGKTPEAFEEINYKIDRLHRIL